MIEANATHLQNFLDALEPNQGKTGDGLPNDLQRNLALIGILDQKAADCQQKVDVAMTDVLRLASGVKGENGQDIEPTEAQLLNIRTLQNHAFNLTNEKIALANQAYEMIKSFSDRLDEDLKNFEKELGSEVFADQPAEELTSSRLAPPKNKYAGEKRLKVKSTPAAAAPPAPSSTYGYGKEMAPTESVESPREGEADATGIGMLPKTTTAGGGGGSEEIYCTCRQVSYGEMVACDNVECQYQWFHYSCVGIKRPPKGKWYCEECRAVLGITT